MATSRNRIIYQSQALFMGPSSTGYHIQTGYLGSNGKTDIVTGPLHSADDRYNMNWTGAAGRYSDSASPATTWNRSLIEPLERIQSANFNFTINRQDINEFGQLARLDSLVMESPTVGLDFNYYLTDGGNERKMGFNIPTSFVDGRFPNQGAATDMSNSRKKDQVFWSGDGCVSGKSALSGVLNDPQGNNFYIAVVPDGKDVQANDQFASTGENGYTTNDVIAIGNGFVSDYTIEASVGSIPTASVTVEAFNIKVDDHLSGAPVNDESTFLDEAVPGVTLEGNSGVNRYVFGTGVGNTGTQQYWEKNGTPMNTTGNSLIAALRPGDLTFAMSNSGEYYGFTDMAGDGQAHIQSFTINLPLSRTILQRLGSTFGYARVVDFPLDINCTVSAVVSELQRKNLFEDLCNRQTHDFTLTMKDSSCTTAGNTKLKVTVKNARLDSETFTNAIGDNQTVDMTFTTQVGGANDTNNGIFMEGSYPPFRTINYWPLGQVKDDDAAYKGNAMATNPY